MRRPTAAIHTLTGLAICLAMLFPATAGAARANVPAGFFGIVPQAPVSDLDAQYMRAGGLESIRITVPWFEIQTTPGGPYNWTNLDATVGSAARSGMRVFPFLYGTPSWLAAKPTTLPIDNGKQKSAWIAFVKAAIARYGPNGQFWAEHAPGSASPVPKLPIRTWQIWNEANFFYFDFPVSPTRYAKLLKLSYPVVKHADPGAKVILSGLFGKPDEGGARGMPAAKFLEALYRVPGIKADFDGVALHPYAFHTNVLKKLIGELQEVIVANHDHPAFYITEMGWGSQNDSHIVAFEQGVQGQARELKKSYGYLIANQRKLNVKGVYWFSWKDIKGGCTFCDSVGLFGEGEAFVPKPAWLTFVKIAGGVPSPF